ncbi:MAG: hypothetical protein EZS28_008894 [Streblomastix strix]|uniref:Uncharacterized protein n=1 Tax=Streblomastix strix TaxID=222440 RepID=A0A5J4WL35_9EUKA|nr:MAG: hypothetical protein EZS28_008894 [Streblomastix strix]
MSKKLGKKKQQYTKVFTNPHILACNLTDPHSMMKNEVKLSYLQTLRNAINQNKRSGKVLDYSQRLQLIWRKILQEKRISGSRQLIQIDNGIGNEKISLIPLTFPIPVDKPLQHVSLHPIVQVTQDEIFSKWIEAKQTWLSNNGKAQELKDMLLEIEDDAQEDGIADKQDLIKRKKSFGQQSSNKQQQQQNEQEDIWDEKKIVDVFQPHIMSRFNYSIPSYMMDKTPLQQFMRKEKKSDKQTGRRREMYKEIESEIENNKERYSSQSSMNEDLDKEKEKQKEEDKNKDKDEQEEQNDDIRQSKSDPQRKQKIKMLENEIMNSALKAMRDVKIPQMHRIFNPQSNINQLLSQEPKKKRRSKSPPPNNRLNQTTRITFNEKEGSSEDEEEDEQEEGNQLGNVKKKKKKRDIITGSFKHRNQWLSKNNTKNIKKSGQSQQDDDDDDEEEQEEQIDINSDEQDNEMDEQFDGKFNIDDDEDDDDEDGFNVEDEIDPELTGKDREVMKKRILEEHAKEKKKKQLQASRARNRKNRKRRRTE